MDYLDSYSGSKFELYEKNNNLYLKKFYKTLKKREILSFQKQNEFKSFYFDGFKIQSAKIFKVKEKEKFIIINYFDGLSGSELLLNGDLNIHKILNNFLKKYIQNIIENSKAEYFDKKPYINKCKKIQSEISNHQKYIFNKIFKSINLKLNNIKYNFKGYCHGDLTLSNIIIDKNLKKIILIDFLTSYRDSPLQDICKLIQDLRLHWSSRKLNETNKLRAKIFCENLNPFLFIKKNSYYKILELEMLMTLLRILPYVSIQDHITLKWIDNSFEKLNESFFKNL